MSVAEPKGAFYLFPDFSAHADTFRERGILTSDDFCSRLLEDTGVACLPGSAFGRPPEEFTARLAYVDFDGAQALAAVEQAPPDKPLDASFAEQYCGQCIHAVNRIGDWLSS